MTGVGLPPKNRLRRSTEFRRVFTEGRRAADGLLVMTAVRNEGPALRFGLAVSGRTGGAVVRNRIRRRLREILRELDAAPGYDVVVSARPAAATATFWRLKESVEKLSRRLGLLTEVAGPPAAGGAGRRS